MSDLDIDKYCDTAIKRGASHAKQIHPSSVVTAAWVRLKCQFGCAIYCGRTYCCPPYTPTPEQTRAIIDCYHRAILFHLEFTRTRTPEKRAEFLEMVAELEIEMFKDGYYKSFAFLQGPCHLCKECAKLTGSPCNFGLRARPSMEACGIDVYQTARNNGFFIVPLRERTEIENLYCLLLVD